MINSNTLVDTEFVDFTTLRTRHVITSRSTLHRYLKRAPGENPFPAFLRDPVSGRRYWRLDDVLSWQDKETVRRRTAPAVLSLDGDPAKWTPRRNFSASAETNTTSGHSRPVTA